MFLFIFISKVPWNKIHKTNNIMLIRRKNFIRIIWISKNVDINTWNYGENAFEIRLSIDRWAMRCNLDCLSLRPIYKTQNPNHFKYLKTTTNDITAGLYLKCDNLFIATICFASCVFLCVFSSSSWFNGRHCCWLLWFVLRVLASPLLCLGPKEPGFKVKSVHVRRAACRSSVDYLYPATQAISLQ